MGVKSLWTLLEPVGRPVPLETMEGKIMAIDSSIWIYQFQATMRDKEGRGLVNAHVVGFLRRICKLLFYGIKPVFVFDGGAPTLKKSTITERKSKKSGAAASHAKIAERLLAAQMRREALTHVQSTTSKGKKKDGPVTLNDDTVYLEDLAPGAPKTPKKAPAPTTPQDTPPSSKKSRWRDHDPYRLPEVDMDATIAKATRAVAPDPRLATEEELQAFIDEMRPEDFDVTSPEFRELPTEVQYEIIGDLRLKSRQTSYKRLQNMLRKAKTPLDFSKEQIKNLKQRNSLTQQLLVTTDSIGKAHVEIPIRVASERNRQYMLIKNEGVEGGWILGIRDDGTAAKPIEIDQDPIKVEEDEDSDMDMEEVEISQSEPATHPDPDLREYQRTNAIQALSKRRPPKKFTPTKKVNRKPKSKPLFYPEPDDPDAQMVDDDLDDEVLVAAIQASVEEQEEQEALDLQRAMELSSVERLNGTNSYLIPTNIGASSSRSTLENSLPPSTPAKASFHNASTYTTISDDEDLYASPTRLETALAIAGASPSKKPTSRASKNALTYSFGAPSHLLQDPPASVFGDKTTPRRVSFNKTRPFTPPSVSSNSKKPSPLSTAVQREKSITPIGVSSDEEDLLAVIPSAPLSSNVSTADDKAAGSSRASPIPVDNVTNSDEDDDMEEVVAPPIIHVADANETERPSVVSGVDVAVDMPEAEMGRIKNAHSPQGAVSDVTPPSNTLSTDEPSPHPPASREFIPTGLLEDPSDSSDEDSDADLWSAVPSLPVILDTSQPETSQHPSSSNAKTQEITEDWDAAQEMDPQAEEGEFVRFMSQVRGKDLDSVRREIDDEIRSLNQQRKVAMRDSEDITQQMISQIMMMLRLFGIPYITAPMEAEAQCAELLSLELVDGIITDDSDVFLFGGARVFKNMFNQSKTVECFLLSDLERELGLERDKLIRLAYLLGSDYTDGLPGVGPVVAMELLTEFPDLDGLHKFKEWWRKVQSGRDKQDESANKFRKRFKKRFKELFLADDWPNPAVRDAYYHPTVDHSDEPFKWGLPDLDALRDFFGAELGWSQSKVDDLLLPIIQKMNKRTQQGALNKQGNLTAFFDVPAGGGVSRKRQAYSSKRLQQVVSDFRKKQRAEGDAQSRGDSSEAEPGEDTSRPKKKRKASETPSTSSSRKNEASRGAGRGRGRGRGRGGKAARGRKAAKSKAREGSDSSGDEFQEGSTVPAEVIPDQPLSVELRPRPKPRMRRKAADVEANDIASE